MKSLIILITLTAVSAPASIYAADELFIKKGFLEETGFTEECNDTAFVNCIGVKKNDCHSSVKSCSEIFPSLFLAKQSEKLINELSSCMLENIKVTNKTIYDCDQKSSG